MLVKGLRRNAPNLNKLISEQSDHLTVILADIRNKIGR